MLTYELHDKTTEPLYEQLYRLIREDISSGRLPAGMHLPSKRALAKHLSISTITVENAYAQLMTEGYIFARPRCGYYVCDLGTYMKSMHDRETDMQGTDGYADDDVPLFADFSSNQTQPESFPFTTWARLTREVLSGKRDDLMKNPPTGGIYALRSAIAGYLRSFRGISVSPGQIVVGAGTEYLYGLLIQLLGFDKVYATENPGYRKTAQVFASYGVRHETAGIDRNGIRVPDLEKSGAQVVHVTPSHHFPTGVTMPVTRRCELLDWARADENRYIIEDDYDSEFRMSGRPLPALCSIDHTGKVIYMNTFTKSLASTVRISYMVLPPALTGRFEREMSFYSCTVPTFEQYTLEAFISSGLFEKHINRMRTLSRKKRDLLLRQIRCRLRDRAEIFEENAGLHFLMHLPLDGQEEYFAARLAEQGIRMRSLDAYLSAPGGSDAIRDWEPGAVSPAHTFVVNYSSVPLERIEEAVERIACCMESLPDR